MSDDINEEMRKMKEELNRLKDQLKDEGKRRDRPRGLYIDVGSQIEDYVGDLMESVAEGVHGELEKSIFIGPRGVRIFKGRRPEAEDDEADVDFAGVSEVMSALGEEHRLKILKELVSGGKYINEIQEKLPEITTSTLSSHLNVLEAAGLVVQEKVRGRYLITLPGRTAYRTAIKVAAFVRRNPQE